MKSCKNLICYSCIFNVQMHIHMKKWTLKLKLLYLRNWISYFNKICSICYVNTVIQSLKVWLKSILSWLKYSIFSRELFLLAHPVEETVHYFSDIRYDTAVVIAAWPCDMKSPKCSLMRIYWNMYVAGWRTVFMFDRYINPHAYALAQ